MRDVVLFIAVVVLGAAVAPARADEPWRLGTPLEAPGGVDEAGASLSFTPRLPGVFDLESARVTLNYAPFAIEAEGIGAHTRRADGFSVGGALAVDRFVVEGALARSSSSLVERERLDAAVSFGGFTTRMHLQDTEPAGAGAGSTGFGIGADLEAAPGLSLGAGLNFAEDTDGDDADTSGVVRFRLRF